MQSMAAIHDLHAMLQQLQKSNGWVPSYCTASFAMPCSSNRQSVLMMMQNRAYCSAFHASIPMLLIPSSLAFLLMMHRLGAVAWQSLQAPDALWRVEEAKLLWAQGQTNLALRLLHAMINRMPAQLEADDAQRASHAGLLTLAGKWMAHTR